MPSIPFPKSSTPGRLTGDGEGRLVNCFTEKSGDTILIRRAPGISSAVYDVSKTNLRSLVLGPGEFIYGVWTGAVTRAGATLAGSVGGSTFVSFGMNNASPQDLVAVRDDGGAYVITSTTVSSFADADLPAAVNSATGGDGYIFFSTISGQIWATDLNALTVDPLSFATAESSPDALYRVIWKGGVLYAMGASTIEPWINVGTSPFPLQRHTSVIQCGLLYPGCVAGNEEGWDHNLFFVAHDRTFRELVGYQTKIVSTPAVDRFIATSDVTTIRVFVFTTPGHAFCVVTSSTGTWVYDVRTGLWHERVSVGQARWRGLFGVKSGHAWYIGDILTGDISLVGDEYTTEVGAAIDPIIESSAFKDYPIRVAIPAAFFDFTKSTGTSVAVSWSHDGGTTYNTPISKSLTDLDKGPVRINRIGLTTQHGVRFRLTVSGGVEFTFLGGSIPEAEVRKP